MDLAVKLVTLIGALSAASGLFWMFFGVHELFQGRKNKNPAQRDEGQEHIINGFGLAVSSGSIAAIIVAALRAITF